MPRNKDLASGNLFEEPQPSEEAGEEKESSVLDQLIAKIQKLHPDWDKKSVVAAARTELNFEKQKERNKGKPEEYPEDELLR